MYSLDKLKSELLLVTPEIAKSLRESAHYERQRPINQMHVTRLATEMEKGRFVAGTQIHICQIGDALSIINGNHTLEAVIASGVSVPLDILYSEVRNEDEVARLYARHDIGRWRDWAATIRAAGLYDKIHAPKMSINNFGGACLYILCDFAHIGGGGRESKEHNERRTSRDVRVEKMREYQPFAERYFSCITDATGALLRRLHSAPVLAAALETFRYQPGKAKEFWTAVAQNEGLKRGDPRRTLVNYLIELPSQSNNRSILPRAVAAAWEAWYDGRDLQIIRIHAAVPFKLAGTPWGKEPKAAAFKPTPKVAAPILKTGVRPTADGAQRVATVR